MPNQIKIPSPPSQSFAVRRFRGALWWFTAPFGVSRTVPTSLFWKRLLTTRGLAPGARFCCQLRRNGWDAIFERRRKRCILPGLKPAMSLSDWSRLCMTESRLLLALIHQFSDNSIKILQESSDPESRSGLGWALVEKQMQCGALVILKGLPPLAPSTDPELMQFVPFCVPLADFSSGFTGLFTP